MIIRSSAIAITSAPKKDSFLSARDVLLWSQLEFCYNRTSHAGIKESKDVRPKVKSVVMKPSWTVTSWIKPEVTARRAEDRVTQSLTETALGHKMTGFGQCQEDPKAEMIEHRLQDFIGDQAKRLDTTSHEVEIKSLAFFRADLIEIALDLITTCLGLPVSPTWKEVPSYKTPRVPPCRIPPLQEGTTPNTTRASQAAHGALWPLYTCLSIHAACYHIRNHPNSFHCICQHCWQSNYNVDSNTKTSNYSKVLFKALIYFELQQNSN